MIAAGVIAAVVVAALVVATVVIAAAAGADGLGVADALILGMVEGLTEYLPVSSTGHLTVTQRLLGIGTTDADRAAADSYAIVIQAGAILAVLVLYRRRVLAMARGLVGRDEGGRHLLGVMTASFLPAALLGLALGDTIKERLFGVGPVAGAWAVGGVAILVLGRRLVGGDRPLEGLRLSDGLVIGAAQALALWPGVSRSLVTILAALALGLALGAAVEYSFLLGLVTLGAATVYEAVGEGSTIVAAYGLVTPAVGFVVAFVSAVAAVRWMVGYLQDHGLALFGWYRLAIAALAAVLLATGVV